MAQRGGKRPGAGRKKGTPNKATQAQREAVQEAGLTPLDYLLSVMRDETAEQALRIDCAHKAAPYVHPKLSSVDHKSTDGSIQMPSVIQFVGVGDGDDGEG